MIIIFQQIIRTRVGEKDLDRRPFEQPERPEGHRPLRPPSRRLSKRRTSQVKTWTEIELKP